MALLRRYLYLNTVLHNISRKRQLAPAEIVVQAIQYAPVLAAEEVAAVVENAIHHDLLVDGARYDREFHHRSVDVALVPPKLICTR